MAIKRKRRGFSYWLYRARFKLAGFGIPGKFPVHVDIELAGKCQLKCTMCGFGEGTFSKDRQGMMPRHMAHNVVLQASRRGAKSIKFNFRGEPGLCKFLPEMVEKAKQLGIVEVAINTNLTAFTEESLDRLCAAGLDLMIVSIDGIKAATYEKIRIGGNFNRLLERLDYLCAKQNRPRVRLQMVEQETNRWEACQLMNHGVRGLGDEVKIQPNRWDNTGARKRCPQPYQRLVVAWDGKVFACCNNWKREFVVGKFPERNLYEIWNHSVKLRKLRYASKKCLIDPCKDCKVGGSYK